MKFQNLEPNDVLLSSKDLPKLPLIFYIKECLSPALSVAKPIAFEIVFFPLTSVPVSHCKTHNLFYNIQKMNCLLPSIWSFTQAFFFVPVAAESFTEWTVGSVETRVETEYLLTNIDPKKNWTNIVPRAGILNFRYSTAMCKYELQLRFGALWCEWTLL